MSTDFFKKSENIFFEPVSRYPYRDKQQDSPIFCPGCGQEQYEYDRMEAGLCARCLALEAQREENAMTLKEMSVEYWSQEGALDTRIRRLRAERKQTDDPAVQAELDLRLRPLLILRREAREQADLLEHYYDRGYYRDARYTL